MAKHTISKSTTVYTKLLKKAWSTTWTHKELWLFGLLAGFAYSGTILQNIIENILRVRPANQLTIEALRESSLTLEYVAFYGKRLIMLSTDKQTLTIAATVVLALFAIYIIVTAQHILLNTLHRAATKKKHISLRAFFAARRHEHALRLFSVNAISYITTTIITLGATIPLLYLLSSSYIANLLVYLAIYLVVLPLLFVINILTIFTLIHIVRKEQHIDTAFKRAWHVCSNHWLVVLEISLILFLINIASFIIFFAVASLIAAVALPLFLAATATGATSLAISVGVLGGLVAVVLYLLYFGIISTFNYAVWTETAERVERFKTLPAFEALLAKFRS